MKQIITLLILSVLLFSCASKKVNEEQFSGFLKSYKNLKEKEAVDGVDVLSWRSDAFKKGKYHSILLDKVALYPEVPSDDDISKTTVTAMLNHLDSSLNKEISANLKLATAPGPGVARLRIAVTSVDKTIKDYKWYSYVPITFVITSASEVAGLRNKAVFLLVEAELVDSVSNEPMLATVRKDFGTPVDKKEQIKLDNIKETLDRWAANVGKFVKEEF